MTVADELKGDVHRIVWDKWDIHDGNKIPDTDSIGLGNKGTRVDVAVLYSDIGGWTDLVRSKKDWFAAEIAKALFLVCNVRIIRSHGGVIASFDGDRVMGIFHGSRKNTDAAESALNINWAVTQVITPTVRDRYSDQQHFSLDHTTGVDRSTVLVTRSGIRNNNDLVWIGRAANYAAKLSEHPGGAASYVTADVYNHLNEKAKYSKGNGRKPMWKAESITIAGRAVPCYSSTWWRVP